jgi:hypothetical protein
MTERAVQAILDDPSAAKLPKELGNLYALISYVGAMARKPKVLAAAGVLLSRLSPELAVLLARDVLRLNPRFGMDRNYQAFLATHSELLA